MAAVAVPTPASSSIFSTERAFPLRILVDSDVVGAIIGRSGTTIKSITSQTNARIDVHRDESPNQKEKVITISGSPESCSEACFQILKICHNEYNVNNLYRGEISEEQKDEFSQSTYSNADAETLHILAPGNLIGRLIGKGGASIKRMMEQTSTRIKISVNSITESTGEHIITVIGNLERLSQAEKYITTKLRTAYFSDMNLSLQSLNQQPYLFNSVPLSYVASGSYATHHQNPLLASMVSQQGGHGTNSISRSVPMNQHHHQGQIHPHVYSNAAGYLPLYPNINVTHSAAGGLVGFNSMVPRLEQERETVYIYIPCTMVGAIIGKAGSAIKEMISTSGATIKVATTPSPTTTSVSEPASNLVESNGEANNNTITQQDNEQNASDRIVDESNVTNPTPSKENLIGTLEDVLNSTQASSRDTNNARQKFNNTNLTDAASTRKVTIIGYPASQYSAQYLIYRKVAMESDESDISLKVELHVPTRIVGKIIGKGGASIKNLQRQTRTTIRLPDEKPSQSHQQTTSTNSEEQHSSSSSSTTGNGSPETTILIIGKFEGSQAAQRHIRSIIQSKS